MDALLAEARRRADKQYPGGMADDDDVAGLRAMLTRNAGNVGEILKRPGRSGTNQTLYMLMAAAFTTAVRMRFGTDATPATRPEVAQYIADVRGRTARAKVALGFDWTAAERLILEVLEDGDEDEDDIGGKTRFAVYVAFTMVIVHDERLDELGIEAFMLLSRERADKWLAPDAMTVRFG